MNSGCNTFPIKDEYYEYAGVCSGCSVTDGVKAWDSDGREVLKRCYYFNAVQYPICDQDENSKWFASSKLEYCNPGWRCQDAQCVKESGDDPDCVCIDKGVCYQGCCENGLRNCNGCINCKGIRVATKDGKTTEYYDECIGNEYKGGSGCKGDDCLASIRKYECDESGDCYSYQEGTCDSFHPGEEGQWACCRPYYYTKGESYGYCIKTIGEGAQVCPRYDY